jgi:hypothetical protein
MNDNKRLASSSLRRFVGVLVTAVAFANVAVVRITRDNKRLG